MGYIHVIVFDPSMRMYLSMSQAVFRNPTASMVAWKRFFQTCGTITTGDVLFPAYYKRRLADSASTTDDEQLALVTAKVRCPPVCFGIPVDHYAHDYIISCMINQRVQIHDHSFPELQRRYRCCQRVPVAQVSFHQHLSSSLDLARTPPDPIPLSPDEEESPAHDDGGPGRIQ